MNFVHNMATLSRIEYAFFTEVIMTSFCNVDETALLYCLLLLYSALGLRPLKFEVAG